ncbi:cytochrome c oxidase assembly protein [Bacillus benzoevorans]|uniref:Putative membrane protein n=1 Tax=Bacillus benzoevorans TaxID=1456 RepID=A0A7X0LYA5_9BACI|nr:cytochrome c oxidase assembly protein [Bacillus benzoevorans]MBB6447254.1 putative membrane protein [Bacillus benzoevorans]
MFYELWLIGDWVWNIPLLLGLVFFSMIYLYFLRLLPDSTAFYKQTLLLFLALSLFYIMVGSPFAQLSHLSFSLHMLQMSIMYFVVPPLILLGIPYPLFQRVINHSLLRKISRLLPPPMVSLILFAMLFTMYHMPVVLNYTTQHVLWQNSYVFLMFALSFSMWRPLTDPNPKQRLTKKQMKLYGFHSGLILMPACLLFILNIFSGQIHNPFLAQITAHLCLPLQMSSFDILPPFFNSKIDQFIAGILMLAVHKFSIMTSVRLGSRISEGVRADRETEGCKMRKVEYKA